MKIEKEILQRFRAQLKSDKPSLILESGPFSLDRNQQRQVVEFALELIAAADGGPDIAKLRQELAEKENQLKLILADVDQAVIAPGVTTTDKLFRARYIITAGMRYLRLAKTKDFQSWKDYQVMMDEEFGESQ